MTPKAEELLNRIREAGVVGAGGAGFPTYKKLESHVEYVIANGAECEPLLQKDREFMLQDRDAFFRGLQIMRELTAARNVTIAVKRKNEDVAAGFQQQADAAGFKTFVYEDVYPAGDEYVQEAVEVGSAVIARKGLLVEKVVIPAPRPEIVAEFI